MSMPIEVSWRYQLPTSVVTDWVTVVSTEDGMVSVEGLYGDKAAWSVPAWKFEGLVVNYEEGGYLLQTEDDLYILATEDGLELLGI